MLVNFWTREHGRGQSGDLLTWRATDMTTEFPSTSAAKQRSKNHPGVGGRYPLCQRSHPGTFSSVLFSRRGIALPSRASSGALFLPELLLHHVLVSLPTSRPTSSPVTSQHLLSHLGQLLSHKRYHHNSKASALLLSLLLNLLSSPLFCLSKPLLSPRLGQSPNPSPVHIRYQASPCASCLWNDEFTAQWVSGCEHLEGSTSQVSTTSPASGIHLHPQYGNPRSLISVVAVIESRVS